MTPRRVGAPGRSRGSERTRELLGGLRNKSLGAGINGSRRISRETAEAVEESSINS